MHKAPLPKTNFTNIPWKYSQINFAIVIKDVICGRKNVGIYDICL
jgi:hypothetical protein